ncbi:MAG: DnaD domain protein [Clostridia bacterium]|nr:DnaD domain protein [Clostridia bacterium]
MKNNKDGGYACPPLGGSAALFDASTEELRVLLCLLTGTDGKDTAALAAAAGCSTARAKSALRYWEEVGVLTADLPITAKPLERSDEPEELPAAEIAETINELELAAFIDQCQQVVGHIFNTRELNALTALIEEMPFSQEYLLTLVNYTRKKVKNKRFSVRYLEKVAHSMLERECLTVEQLNEYLARAERFSAEEWRLRRLFGIGERRLSSREEECFMRWTGEYLFGEEIIGIAYDITVNQTGKVSLPYIDKLLSSFRAAGCRTVREVEEYLEKERAEHAARKTARAGGGKTKKDTTFTTDVGENDPSATRGSSFRPDDYLSAALRRSYGDDGKET